MKITKTDYEKATVLSLKGKIKIGNGDVALREAIDQVVAEGATNLVLDVQGVSRIDSSGLGELVAAHKRLTNLGGQLSLARMSSNLLNVVGATQIVSILDVFGTEEEALASFK